jgi:hypothetical protein
MRSSCPKLKVSAAGMDKCKVRRLDMADIPLDLQRRFEQRWAARFVRPVALKKQELERQDQQLTEPGKDKRKTHRIKPVGIRSAPAV